MIRLLFIPFFAILLFSCENDSKKVDPLFYQISVADSTRCMNEILDGILEEGIENQRFIDELFDRGIPYCGILDRFYIGINSSGLLMLNKQIDSVQNITEKVVEFFMFNRNLKNVDEASMDVSYPGFDFPFYNKWTLKEIQYSIESYQKNINELDKTDSSYFDQLKRLELKVNDWKQNLRVLELIDEKYLPQLAPAHITFEYHPQSKKVETVLNNIALAFYQTRNYECLRYFSESYLNLFDRAQRRNRKLDRNKLLALEVIQRPILFDRPWQK
ncbi:MAG: hypothetical protein HRT58_07455 [Crocinitomicaceae bacterium]|nr:hypothetical protein [Flavobacteriales bacterium]NQZ35485.1 hypothetical protein [Crocinitomicaceae bacterium]